MKVIRHEDKSINVMATLKTFEPGEVAKIQDSKINIDNLRNRASRVARAHGWKFSISANRKENGNYVIITRIS